MSDAERHEGEQGDKIGERFNNPEAMQAALKEAMRRVLREHARAGRKIVIWKDGEVVWEDAAKRSADDAR